MERNALLHRNLMSARIRLEAALILVLLTIRVTAKMAPNTRHHFSFFFSKSATLSLYRLKIRCKETIDRSTRLHSALRFFSFLLFTARVLTRIAHITISTLALNNRLSLDTVPVFEVLNNVFALESDTELESTGPLRGVITKKLLSSV